MDTRFNRPPRSVRMLLITMLLAFVAVVATIATVFHYVDSACDGPNAADCREYRQGGD